MTMLAQLRRRLWVRRALLLGGFAEIVCGLVLAFRGSYDGVFLCATGWLLVDYSLRMRQRGRA